MFKLIQNLLQLNGALLNQAKSIQIYDEALALHGAKEFRAAFPKMLEAAQLGNTHAASVLGSMYLLGQGCPENGKEAEKWLRKAVADGYDEAKSLLAMALATGKAGVPQNLAEAISLLREMAEKGEEQSARMLRMIERGEGMFRKTKKQAGRGHH